MGPCVEFQARLIEEAVWAAIRDRAEERAFHSEREGVYAETDAERREEAFVRLHVRWFQTLGLGDVVRCALEEQGEAFASVLRVLALLESQERKEGAELFVTVSGERTVVIRLRPERLRDGDGALEFLRKEMMHVTDMLDPDFQYEPRLPRRTAGPSHDRLLQDRYRVLWGCSVDGRLLRLGRVGETARERRLREFRRQFGSLEGRTDECFDRVFNGPRPRHPDLVGLAWNPRRGFGLPAGPSGQSGRCPLCGFPTRDFEPQPEVLPGTVFALIRSEFPRWRAESGLCRQCADLYRARSLSLPTARRPPDPGADNRGP